MFIAQIYNIDKIDDFEKIDNIELFDQKDK